VHPIIKEGCLAVTADPSLTTDEKRKLAEWLKIRAVKACPMCGVSKWGIADHLVAAPPYTGNGIAPDISYPQAMLVCGNCAYTAFFNAAIVGLLRKDKDEESSA
jgi:ribosomal protein S27AE